MRTDRLGEQSQFEEALSLLDQALVHIERTDERANEAETLRLRGKLLFSRNPDDFASAEACARRAIEVARGQQAKVFVPAGHRPQHALCRGVSGALADYQREADLAFAQYLDAWCRVYASEGRWPGAPFWQRRRGQPAR
jgi:tetratricopeptide (TPR) repeat protein